MKSAPSLAFVALMLIASACNIERKESGDWKITGNPLLTEWSHKVDPMMPWPQYPRPGMEREVWMNLNGLWDFAITGRDERPREWTGKILVPYPVESALSGVRKSVTENQLIWYRRDITIPEDWAEKRVLLHFEASDWETSVEIDGKPAGSHRGGYDPFSFDITELVKAGLTHEISVCVWDPTDKGNQPRGKQVLNPRGILYTPVSGIWQTVWLEPVDNCYIKSFRVYTDIRSGEVTFIPELSALYDNLKLSLRLVEKAEVTAESDVNPGNPLKITVPDFKLWSPSSPELYNCEILLLRNDTIIDNIRTYFGFRDVTLGKDSDGFTKILLNGRFLFQNGPLDQGFWPDGIYTPPTEEAMLYDLEMTQKMGFNMLRKHVKVENRRFYYWCDKMGLLVWQDMPSGDKFIGSSDPDIEKDSVDARQFEFELSRMIETRFNNPSIIIWVPFNEGWGQFETGRITDFIRAADPTRLVNSASGWTDRGTGDIKDIHHYPGPVSPEPEAGRAIVLGEFGGLGLPVQGHTWEQKNWGYQNMINSDELVTLYEDYYSQVYELVHSKGLSAVVYTQTTDVETETNGLMTYDRKIDKMGFERVFRANRGMVPPLLVNESTIFTDRYAAVLKVNNPSAKIYYTTDGSDPADNKNLYTGPVIIEETTELRTLAIYREGESSTRSYTITRSELTPPSEIENPGPGLSAKIFNGSWTVLPDFDKEEAERELVASTISTDVADNSDNTGIRFEGFIAIPEDGVYGLFLSSDDGSRLYLDNEMIIDNDGIHGMREKRSFRALARGYHPVMIDYFQGTGGIGLSLSISGPGLSKQEVPAGMLYR